MISRRQFVTRAAVAPAALAWSARQSWAVEQGTSSPFRIALFTDIHARTEWDTPEALALCAAKINEAKADLVLCGGDLITDGFQSSSATVAPRWAAYRTMRDTIASPVRHALGNHDLVAALPEDGTPASADPRAEFRTFTGVEKTWQTFEAGGLRVFIVDSLRIGGPLKYEGFVSEEQLAWLRDELTRVPETQPIVLVTHVPLLTVFYGATEGATKPIPANRIVANNTAVLDVFAKHNLLLVLQGHLHQNELMRWRKTTFITGGAVCGKYWRGPWHGTAEGFGVVTLRGRRIDWEYVEYGWTPRRPAGV